VRNVHSLNARDNGLLPWVFARSNNDPGHFRDNIQRDLDQLVTMLRSRQVAYSDLKSALVPPQDGRQVVFLYDWLNDPSWNYAVEFSKHWLPVLRKTLRTSVKDGDLLPPYPAIRHLEHAVHRADNREVRWDTQYAVYFSNLKTSDIELLHTELLTVDRYRGYIDVTYSSLVRNYLARCITRFIQNYLLIEVTRDIGAGRRPSVLIMMGLLNKPPRLEKSSMTDGSSCLTEGTTRSSAMKIQSVTRMQKTGTRS